MVQVGNCIGSNEFPGVPFHYYDKENKINREDWRRIFNGLCQWRRKKFYSRSMDCWCVPTKRATGMKWKTKFALEKNFENKKSVLEHPATGCQEPAPMVSMTFGLFLSLPKIFFQSNFFFSLPRMHQPAERMPK